jgi:hypothetical protein
VPIRWPVFALRGLLVMPALLIISTGALLVAHR